MLSLGPLSVSVLILLMALAAACGTAWIVGRAWLGTQWHQLLSGLADLLLVGWLCARLGFVLRWWPQYASDPGSILMIHDGGYLPLAGVLGALAFGAWRTRGQPAYRRALGLSAVTGVAAWIVLAGTLRMVQQETLRVPPLTLATLDGQRRALSSFTGKPLVVNLWATWCPPCRREMPVLAQAQQRLGGIDFVFVNQGEDAAAIRRYLQGSGLELRNVLLDPSGAAARAIATHGLPATLFFDANGRLAATHFGPLSAASLSAKLSRVDG